MDSSVGCPRSGTATASGRGRDRWRVSRLHWEPAPSVIPTHSDPARQSRALGAGGSMAARSGGRWRVGRASSKPVPASLTTCVAWRRWPPAFGAGAPQSLRVRHSDELAVRSERRCRRHSVAPRGHRPRCLRAMLRLHMPWPLVGAAQAGVGALRGFAEGGPGAGVARASTWIPVGGFGPAAPARAPPKPCALCAGRRHAGAVGDAHGALTALGGHPIVLL